MYSMCINGYVSGNFNMKNLLYIDGHPRTHENIASFINSSKLSLFYANCSFEEHFNDQEFFMKRKVSIFVVVHAIHSFSPGDMIKMGIGGHPPIPLAQNSFQFWQISCNFLQFFMSQTSGAILRPKIVIFGCLRGNMLSWNAITLVKKLYLVGISFQLHIVFPKQRLYEKFVPLVRLLVS